MKLQIFKCKLSKGNKYTNIVDNIYVKTQLLYTEIDSLCGQRLGRNKTERL